MTTPDLRKCVLCAPPASVDPVCGMPEEYVQEILKEFDIIWLNDLEKDPSVGVRIEAALVRTPHLESRTMVERNIDHLPNLKVIAYHSVGMEHAKDSLELFKTNGIKVANTPNVLADACADLAMGLIITGARNIIEDIRTDMGSASVINTNRPHKGVNEAMATSMPVFNMNYLGMEVTGATLGIIGLGDIGYKIARRARAFDMKILYHNRKQRPSSVETTIGATFCSTLHALLSQSDFVTITCPLTPQTEGLLGDAEFDAMKSSAILINIARGKIIDQDALVRALQVRKIRKALLDVTYPEPLPRDHPLLKLPNVFITPHCGTATIETRMKMIRLMLDNVRAGLEGRQMPSEYII